MIIKKLELSLNKSLKASEENNEALTKWYAKIICKKFASLSISEIQEHIHKFNIHKK